MKTPKPVLDRRRSIRIAEKLPFKIGHRSYETEATSVNISGQGALCIVSQDIPLMTQLQVALSLPSMRKGAARSKTISMKGVVVRKDREIGGKQYFIAIFFSEIKPTHRGFLEKFIESRLPAHD